MEVLQEIIFENCAFYEIKANAFNGLEKLRTLNFNHCRMGNIHKNFLNGLRNLWNLHLNYISGTTHIRDENFFNPKKLSVYQEKTRFRKELKENEEFFNQNYEEKFQISSYEDLFFNELNKLCVIYMMGNKFEAINKNIFKGKINFILYEKVF